MAPRSVNEKLAHALLPFICMVAAQKPNFRRVMDSTGTVCMFLLAMAAPYYGIGSEFSTEPPPPFAKGSRELAITLGAGPGEPILGSQSQHDMALAVFRAGRTLSDTFEQDTFWEGHCEALGELFAATQYSPGLHYVVGVLPLLRYDFTHWEPLVPFCDLGAGLTLTDISRPDLSGDFQFNEQIGVGAHYLFGERTAVTFEYRFMHISNAGLKEPNHGVNANIFSAGLTWFF
jgi:lipid A 3-O-deacylase PagL